MNIKNIQASVQFNNGTTATVLVPVDKSKYTSFQSKACTYKSTLIAGIVVGKFTQEIAREKWAKQIVAPWNGVVNEYISTSYPQEVVDCIESFAPVSNMLELGDLPANKANNAEIAEIAEIV